jgi:hypothetical protein
MKQSIVAGGRKGRTQSEDENNVLLSDCTISRARRCALRDSLRALRLEALTAKGAKNRKARKKNSIRNQDTIKMTIKSGVISRPVGSPKLHSEKGRDFFAPISAF